MRARTLIATCGNRRTRHRRVRRSGSGVVQYKQGKYQGKPDSQPWDNAPVRAGNHFEMGTRAIRTSWETAIKQRQLNQNEYARTQ